MAGRDAKEGAEACFYGFCALFLLGGGVDGASGVDGLDGRREEEGAAGRRSTAPHLTARGGFFELDIRLLIRLHIQLDIQLDIQFSAFWLTFFRRFRRKGVADVAVCDRKGREFWKLKIGG